ncbi:integral membrane sensor signal transduction histidine kinase [Agrobacterium albertimagni AOL15]|uniref:histidine kinase n=1 Tax=Agrobacterium albertimagni AOL15 TaxID=1156935 RepID=K2R0Z1_9HYPH|nr:HAMP domain-containing sensor histidine kinase [Agrobacterium albertimagni]EKF61497.1 integral membrane sensor signal transduction histidine kinase [Agrobacterium albertimagni AOL15]
MSLLERIRIIPLTVRVPAMVALLMMVVSLIISERVLNRLNDMQEQHLNGVAGTYFDGLSTVLIPAVLRQDVWETYDLLDRTRTMFQAVSPIETVVIGRDGLVLASSDPRKIPVLSALPDAFSDRNASGDIRIDWQSDTGFGTRPLIYQGKTIGTVHASFDISHLVAERYQVLKTLLATNALLALVFAATGYVLTRRMVKPVTTLAQHMRASATGTPNTIPLAEFPRRNGELGDLFHGFNALVEAERERSALTRRLAEEEKLASLGRLASSMAHEINNPLGGLFNSIDTLKQHGANEAVRGTSLSLLERGLAGIRDVVQAALATYRPDSTGRPLVLKDLDDVRLLAGPVVAGRKQTLTWMSNTADIVLPVLSGSTVRQALLNLVLNASAAAGNNGSISVEMRIEDDHSTLILSVSDSGPGLPDAAARVLVSSEPWPAAQSAGGLGLWMVRKMVEDARGHIQLRRSEDRRTIIELHLPISLPGEETSHAA